MEQCKALTLLVLTEAAMAHAAGRWWPRIQRVCAAKCSREGIPRAWSGMHSPCPESAAAPTSEVTNVEVSNDDINIWFKQLSLSSIRRASDLPCRRMPCLYECTDWVEVVVVELLTFHYTACKKDCSIEKLREFHQSFGCWVVLMWCFFSVRWPPTLLMSAWLWSCSLHHRVSSWRM